MYCVCCAARNKQEELTNLLWQLEWAPVRCRARQGMALRKMALPCAAEKLDGTRAVLAS